MKIDIDIKGFDKAIKEIQKAQKKLPKLVDEFGDEVIEVGHDYMERNAPYDTGELVESIQKTRNGNTKSVEVGADHAEHVEYGTHKQPAQPFIRPARQKMEDYVDKNAGGVVDDAY